MKRVLAGAAIAAGIITTGSGLAAATVEQAPQQARIAQVADASTGSSDQVKAQILLLLAALASGSAQPCDGIQMDVCIPDPPVQQ
ncbi:hypothetical protein [Nocardia sp. AG03]|uniref:hypothetical protein n=1 Tax=Nocardia sp. AG03 TaxID=3025312 RepID=UPI002418770F|nr:hypothetical protein [Nocardia sp. AG03]